jgi:site-specific recombinase XerD
VSTPTPTLPDLAEEWVLAKALSSASHRDLSSAARRCDLARCGRLLASLLNRPYHTSRSYDLAGDLSALEPGDLSEQNLRRLLLTLRGAYAPATAERTVSTLRSFLAWLHRRGHIPTNPFQDETLRLPPRPTNPPYHAFDQDELELLLLAAANPPKSSSRSAWPTRDVALVEVLAGCGVRASELCALLLADLDTTAEFDRLDVHRGAKGGRRRVVPLPRPASGALSLYLAERSTLAATTPALTLSPTAPLFVRRSGAPINPQFLDRFVNRLIDSSPGPVRRIPHTAAHGFRHFYGTQLALRNVPPAVISELMGHQDPRTTARYTRSVGRNLTDPLQDAGWL